MRLDGPASQPAPDRPHRHRQAWLGEAFAERACRSGYSAYCARASRLFHELRVACGDGSYTRGLARLARTDLLVIDDWGLAPLALTERRDLLKDLPRVS